MRKWIQFYKNFIKNCKTFTQETKDTIPQRQFRQKLDFKQVNTNQTRKGDVKCKTETKITRV